VDLSDNDRLLEWVRNRYFGKYRGVVTDNSDPTHRGRMKVRVPAVLGDQQVWAMPCVTYAGDNIGMYATPRVGSGCWVEFEGGDPSFAIISGYFWADGELPTNENGAQATPPVKIVRTEQGLMVSMDDDGQTISVSDANGNNILKIEVQQGQITIKGASKAVVEAPLIELVENSTHPVVFGDELLSYLNQLVAIYQSHLHPGQLAMGVFPVTPAPPTPPFPQATPQLISSRVTTG
jgi:uncharacterized protein involved in type VI secretion and phage assembly